MIFLNKEVASIFKVNPDLIATYKTQGDRYLVDIKRCLSKQLVYYILYTDLQKVNNFYFRIMDKLLKGEYTELYSLKEDYAAFQKVEKSFLKGCEGFIDTTVMESVKKDIDSLDIIIQRFIYILENICYDESEDTSSNEIHSIF